MKNSTQFNALYFFLLSFTILCSCGNQSDKNMVESNDSSIQLEDSFRILYDIGNQKLNANDFIGAIPIFSKAITLNPNNPDPFYCRGYALSALGNDTAAINDYNNTLKLRPDYKGAYFSRAVSYGVLGYFNEAISDYNQVLVLDSLFSNAWFNKGLIKIQIGNKKEGYNDIRKAAKLNDSKAIQFLRKC